MSGPERTRRVAAWLFAAALVGALLWTVRAAQRPPDGPQPVAWDRQACARCSMLISEPDFAAQLHLETGEVIHFDDPGCLLLWRHEHAGAPGNAWFHQRDEPHWLPGASVRFVPVDSSPMGYGLAAAADAPDGLSAAAALALALEREAARRSSAP